MLPILQKVIDASPCGDLTFLVTEFGKPFSAKGFGSKFRACREEAKLPHCTAHGLHKAGAVIAAEYGATPHQLMAIFGWRTLKEAERYTRAAQQKKIATGAMKLLAAGRSEYERGKPHYSKWRASLKSFESFDYWRGESAILDHLRKAAARRHLCFLAALLGTPRLGAMAPPQLAAAWAHVGLQGSVHDQLGQNSSENPRRSRGVGSPCRRLAAYSGSGGGETVRGGSVGGLDAAPALSTVGLFTLSRGVPLGAHPLVLGR